jgi:hypothetical protein
MEWKRLRNGGVELQSRGFGFASSVPMVSERERSQAVGYADAGRWVTEKPWINDGWWPPVTWPHVEREG